MSKWTLYVDRTNWPRPILIRSRAQLSIRLPDPDFGVEAVVEAVGGGRRMEVIDVHKQHSFAMSLGRFASLWASRATARARVYNVISLEFSATKSPLPLPLPSSRARGR